MAKLERHRFLVPKIKGSNPFAPNKRSKMGVLPKKFQYKRYKKGRMNPSLNKKKNIIFGLFALKAVEPGRVTSKQILSGYRFIKKQIKPFKGIVKIYLKLRTPITYKPIGLRMGRGKGKVKSHVSHVYAGTIIYEVFCFNFELAKRVLTKTSHKLSVNSRVETKNVFYDHFSLN